MWLRARIMEVALCQVFPQQLQGPGTGPLAERPARPPTDTRPSAPLRRRRAHRARAPPPEGARRDWATRTARGSVAALRRVPASLSNRAILAPWLGSQWRQGRGPRARPVWVHSPWHPAPRRSDRGAQKEPESEILSSRLEKPSVFNILVQNVF